MSKQGGFAVVNSGVFNQKGNNMKTTVLFRPAALTVAVWAAFSLSACGGGGGGGQPSTAGSNTHKGGLSVEAYYSENPIPKADTVQSVYQKASLDDKHEARFGKGVYVAIIDSPPDRSVPDISPYATFSSKVLVMDNHPKGGKWHLENAQAYDKRDGHGTRMTAVLTNFAPFVTVQQTKHDWNNQRIHAQQSVVAGVNAGARVDIVNQSFADPILKANPQEEYANVTKSHATPIKVLEKMNEQNILVVQSTGNENKTFPSKMAALPLFSAKLRQGGFISVTGYDSRYDRQAYNQCGESTKDWCLASYSVRTRSFSANQPGGTSSAAAMVSGVAARVKARYDWYSNVDLKNTLLSTATDKGAKGVDAVWGHGLINPDAALNGYGRFDKETVLRVQGSKRAYHFDNNIGGAGGLIKYGSDMLVLNGDNHYTGRTVVAQGELVANGHSRSPHTVKAKGSLTVGDRLNTVQMPSVTVEQGGRLDAQAANLHLTGNLKMQGAMFGRIGATVSVDGKADLRNGSYTLWGVRNGTHIQRAGDEYVLIRAKNGIQTDSSTRLNVGSHLSDLVSGDLQIKGNDLVVRVKRTAVGNHVRSLSSFTGRDQTVKALDGLMDYVDASKACDSSLSYYRCPTTVIQGSTPQPPATPAVEDKSASTPVYDYLLASRQLERDVYALDMNHFARLHQHIADEKVARATHLLRQTVGTTGKVWLWAGKGRSQQQGLNGIDADSSDNSQFIGAGKAFGKHRLSAQIGRTDYTWSEQRQGMGKSAGSQGLGMDVAYHYQFNPQWRAYGLLSADRHKGGQGSYLAGLGAAYRHALGNNGIITPYAHLLHTRTGKHDYQANNGFNMAAKNVHHRRTDWEAGLNGAYAWGNKQQFRIDGGVFLRQMLAGHSRYTAQLDGFHTAVSLNSRSSRPDVGIQAGASWQANARVNLSLGAGYQKGRDSVRRDARVGVGVNF